jgi:hypothetical protein
MYYIPLAWRWPIDVETCCYVTDIIHISCVGGICFSYYQFNTTDDKRKKIICGFVYSLPLYDISSVLYPMHHRFVATNEKLNTDCPWPPCFSICCKTMAFAIVLGLSPHQTSWPFIIVVLVFLPHQKFTRLLFCNYSNSRKFLPAGPNLKKKIVKAYFASRRK